MRPPNRRAATPEPIRRSPLLPGQVPAAAGDNEAAQHQPVAAAAAFAEHVAVLELALREFEDRGIADRADREMAEIRPPERRGRRSGAGPDDRGEIKAER